MAIVVNLRTARKRAKRDEDSARAAERRAAFGVPKAERALHEAVSEKALRNLEHHRLGTREEDLGTREEDE